MSAPDFLTIREASFAYAPTDEVLRGLSADFDRGEINYLVGASGSGKTTLAMVLANQLELSAGLVAMELQHAALVLQFPEQMFLEDTVAEELATFDEGAARARAKDAVARLGLRLEDVAAASPESLSFGQRRLLAIALQSAGSAMTLVLDEPTLGLDELNLKRVAEFVAGEHERGRICVVITHDIELIASLPGRVIVLRQGKAAWQGDTREFLSRPDLMRLADML